MRWIWGGVVALVGTLGLVGCGSAPPRGAKASGREPTQLGSTPDAPVLTCGPRDSYAYVAQRFRCPDGTNPLGGDIAKGAQARRGSLPAPTGNHVLDVYDVPCARGATPVYVDMYGCAEYEQVLQESEGTQAGRALLQAFRDGDYQGVIDRCGDLPNEAAADERTLCFTLSPASLYVQMRDAEALSTLTATCHRLHPATTASDARAVFLANLVGALTEVMSKGTLGWSDERRQTMVQKWLENCEVPAAQLEQTLASLQQEQE